MRNQAGDYNKRTQTLALFVDDHPLGMIVECSKCSTQVLDASKTDEEKVVCSGCGMELLYPDGVEW